MLSAEINTTVTGENAPQEPVRQATPSISRSVTHATPAHRKEGKRVHRNGERTGMVASTDLQLERSGRFIPSIICEVVVNEPSGRRYALIMFAGTLVFVSLDGYSAISGESSAASWLVFMLVEPLCPALPNPARRIDGGQPADAVSPRFSYCCLCWLSSSLLLRSSLEIDRTFLTAVFRTHE